MGRKGQIPWNKGKKTGPLSEEHKRKIATGNRGKKTGPFSEEHKRNLSDAHKGKGKGKNNSFFGKKHTEESRCKISATGKGRTPWNKGIKCPQISASLRGRRVSKESRKKMSEAHKAENNEYSNKGRSYIEIYGFEKAKEISERIRRARLKQVLPKKDTSIEVALQKELNLRNIVFEKHIPVCGVCQPDIVFPKSRIAVFADGDYWHNLPHTVKKDCRHNMILQENDWQVLRFWGHEIRDDVSRCVDEVEGVINCVVNH